MSEDAAYKFSVLQPAWSVLCEILKERRLQLLESLVHRHYFTAAGAMLGVASPTNHDEIRGKIQELDETMKILEKLELEAKPR